VSEMTTTEQTKELEAVRKTLEQDPNVWNEEKEQVEKLPDKPTLNQVVSALELTRGDVAQALIEIQNLLEKHERELDKARNHRHDFSKTFSGRAEF
jgi:hypothetical protein